MKITAPATDALTQAPVSVASYRTARDERTFVPETVAVVLGVSS